MLGTTSIISTGHGICSHCFATYIRNHFMPLKYSMYLAFIPTNTCQRSILLEIMVMVLHRWFSTSPMRCLTSESRGVLLDSGLCQCVTVQDEPVGLTLVTDNMTVTE